MLINLIRNKVYNCSRDDIDYDSICASEGIFNAVIIIPCILHGRMKAYPIEKL